MSCQFAYRAFGLGISSEIELPELCSAASNGDVSVRRRGLPAHLDEPLGSGVVYEAKRGQFLLALDRIGRFWVTDGAAIDVDPAPEAAAEDVRPFLLGPAMGALLHQRGFLTLHGSAVETPRGAVVFVGASGAGKSTAAAAMHARGYPLIADDIAAVTLDGDGRPVVHPAFPRLKLWADSAKAMAMDPAGLTPIRAQIEKYFVSAGDFVERPVPIHAVITVGEHNEPDLKLEVVEGPRRFGVILRQTYRRRFLEGLEQRPEHLRIGAATAARVRVWHLKRPQFPFQLDALVARVEEALAE